MPEGQLHIGWSQVEITPPKKTLLLGQFYARLANTAISPLTATALAVETRTPDDSLEQAIFLSCDLAAEDFKSDLRAKLAGRCLGFDINKLTINATHTHNAPPVRSGMYEEPEDDPDFMAPDEYRGFLVDRLADVVESAWEERQPGAISRGFAYAVVGRCRRAVYRDGSARMYGAADREDFLGIEACDDHAVNLLFTHDASGALTGMLVNLACPSQCDEGKKEISADFWHNVRVSLRDRYGPAVHLLPQCAPAGDASPHLLLDQREEKDLRDRAHVDDKGIIARRIMTAVAEAQALLRNLSGKFELRHVVRTLHLPRLRVTPEEYEGKTDTQHESGGTETAASLNVSGRLAPSATSSIAMSIRMRTRFTTQSATLSDSGMLSSPPIPLSFSWTTALAFVPGARRCKPSSCSLQTGQRLLPSDTARSRRRPLQRGNQVQLGRPRRRPDAGGRDLASIDELFVDESYPKTR